MQKKRMYSAEVKREQVALANQPGVSKPQIARELDTNPNMITRWQLNNPTSSDSHFQHQLGRCG